MSAEDKILAKIVLHRDIKNLVIQELRDAGIACQETDFTDPKGDIAIANSSDVPKIKQIVREFQQRANS